MDSAVFLTILGRSGCHLCEEMTRELAVLGQEWSIEIRHVDIDQDPVLAAQFNELVPVLMHGDRELARYRLNSAAVRAYLEEIR